MNTSRSTPTEEQLLQAIRVAKQSAPDSLEASRACQEAIFLLMRELSSTMPKLYQGSGRPAWVDTLTFLRGTLSFPHLDDLLLALEEQERGISPPGLQRKSLPGGLASTSSMLLRRDAVEAADELKRRCSCDEEYRAELKESETSYSTIEKWKRSLQGASPNLRPRVGYRLHWGDEPPEILLQKTIWVMRETKSGSAESHDSSDKS